MKHIVRGFLPIILLFIVAAFTFRFSETARVGGPGGRRTVIMECGSGSYMVGLHAVGGKDWVFGFNLLRRIKFECRSFNGTTAASSGTTTTTEAVGDKPGTDVVSRGSGTCTGSSVLNALELRAGLFIDRMQDGFCIDASQNQSFLHINVGGDAGTRAFLECPAAEALYKVEARVGDAIDSMKGYCRAFGTVGSLSVPTQINSTANPMPSVANPLSIPINSSKSISFTIANIASATVANVLIGITGETDLLGGGIANPPEFKVELINPSGSVVASKTFVNTNTSLVSGVTFTINANGTWKFKITNLKRTIGTLNVKTFGGTIANWRS